MFSIRSIQFHSIQFFFWINLGFIGIMLRDYLPEIKLTRKAKITFLIISMLVFALRTVSVTKQQYPENFYSGFHGVELQPDGRSAGWTGRRGVMRIPSGEGDLVIGLKCPIPAVARRLQEVKITVSFQPLL